MILYFSVKAEEANMHIVLASIIDEWTFSRPDSPPVVFWISDLAPASALSLHSLTLLPLLPFLLGLKKKYLSIWR